MVKLIEASSEDRTLLWNIHQKYLYEMTNYYDNEMDGVGNYNYGYFAAYFSEPGRTALLIYDGSILAGFALINPYSYIKENPDHVMAEFTVFPAHRRKHLAEETAEIIFKKYGGRWEIKYNEKNTAARELWNKVTKKYSPKRYRYSDTETVLSFTTL